jgi:hypothetical protein
MLPLPAVVVTKPLVVVSMLEAGLASLNLESFPIHAVLPEVPKFILICLELAPS